jgi:hypothetical protein
MFGPFCPKRPFSCIDLCLTKISIFSSPHCNNQFFFHLHSHFCLMAILIFYSPHGNNQFFFRLHGNSLHTATSIFYFSHGDNKIFFRLHGNLHLIVVFPLALRPCLMAILYPTLRLCLMGILIFSLPQSNDQYFLCLGGSLPPHSFLCLMEILLMACHIYPASHRI